MLDASSSGRGLPEEYLTQQQNSEKYIIFCCKQLELKDSFSFLSSSFDKLAT